MKLLCTFLFSLAITAAGFAQDKFFVAVEVKANNEPGIERTIKRYLETELKKSRDIGVTEIAFDPNFVMRVLVQKVVTPSRPNLGYAISASINFKTFCADGTKTPSGNWRLYECESNQNHMINVGGVSDIENICKKMIADFNKSNLDPVREAARKESKAEDFIQDYVRKTSPKRKP